MGMAEDVLDDLRKRINKTLDDLRRELAKVRTGRANPALLEGVRVDYYGQMSPLNNVSNVTVADPRLIVIKPWEKSMIPVIEKAINAAGLGVNAQSDAELVRVPIPPLTEERRREFVKLVKHKGEEHKIAIRNERRDAKEMIEEAVKEGELTEDDGKKAMEKLQTEVDNGVKKVDEVIASKEKDLMQV
ncbi:MAG: ribosome recycling factor [Deltaproteobacteria bacterium]|nr:MAG: ribosome recycling factor [Deltaproteobacteria bacterium]TMB14921.1 MAG: ribosome recycling factor [Deltaproteobacteria bacterium]